MEDEFGSELQANRTAGMHFAERQVIESIIIYQLDAGASVA